MAQYFIERAVYGLILRHQNDGAAAGFERGADVAQRAEIVLHMLHHVEANHGIELRAEFRKIRRVAQVALADAEIGAPPKAHAQAGQMLGIDIARHIGSSPARQMLGHVADTAS